MQAKARSAIDRYYAAPAVRARLAEYCGGRPEQPASFSCVEIAAYGGARRRVEADGGPTRAPNAAFHQLLDEGADLCRSLADTAGAILQLDVDYVSPNDHAEPYRNPRRMFERLEPIHRALSDLFAGLGISPLALVTGRGYHYVVRCRREGSLHAFLVELGAHAPASASLAERAHEGAGRLMEHLAHRALHRLRGRTDVPVTLADVPPPGDGAFVCLDLSAYGDPLRTRFVRAAFSTNQKSAVQESAPERPFCVVLPRQNEPLDELLAARESVAEAVRRAGSCDATIPDVWDAPRLTRDYSSGPVARFHKSFDRGPCVPREEWPFTYDSLDLASLPACASVPLAFPNPLLLRPACLRSVCLTFWAMGWHPRSIAELVRSKFERDYGWNPSFEVYDPALRAQFYVRVLCGALADRLDSPESFTCATQRARGLCQPDHCPTAARQLFESLGPRLRRAARQ